MTEEELRNLEAKCLRDAYDLGDQRAMEAVILCALARPVMSDPDTDSPSPRKSLPKEGIE
jgi:hypothetical protein